MSIIEKIAFYAIELINEQIEKGVDVDGKSYKYSTKPFAMPAKRNLKGLKTLQKEGRLKPFTANGKLWQLVTGGYKDWRVINNRNPEGDYLQWSGSMLKSISARAKSDTSSVIYFTSPEQAQKAFWFNVSGVGKTRRLWKFFGLTDENENRLLDYAAGLVLNDPKFIDEAVSRIKTDLKARS